MPRRPLFWYVVSLLCLAGAIMFWELGDRWQAQKAARSAAPVPAASSATPTKVPAPAPAAAVSPATNGPHPYRLSNTRRSLDQLLRDDHAILLANALIDTTLPVDLKIPDKLRSPANNGTYLVQAKGPINGRFRSLLQSAGATLVSYIPNNTELVRVSSVGAAQIGASPLTQIVLPWEPYYKLEPSLLSLAVTGKDLPPDEGLSLVVENGARAATLAALAQAGADVVGESRSPFGALLQVHPARGTYLNLVSLPGVMMAEPIWRRQLVNDLMRPRLGVSADGQLTTTNYLGLTGSNVVVNINDSGVDGFHPDFTGRLSADQPGSLFDWNGHGTHVAGTILGDGSQSASVTTASGSTLPGAGFQGMAPNALGYVIALNGFDTGPGAGNGSPPSDAYLQEQAAQNNAPISNNSWNYGGDAGYDVAAASYDAAVRDALPLVSGSQPVLFVFAAGNDGGGDQSGQGGNADSILSPGTAKNVITVGAIEQFRNITNVVVKDGITNTTIFLDSTDSSNQVANFSSRGNVGIGIEGAAGRFKPDVVAPGVFVVSDRSTTWDQGAYYNPTSYTGNTFPNQSVEPNALTPFSIFVPENAVSLTITVVTNRFSLSPFPPMPLYVGLNDNPNPTNPGTVDLLTTNTATLPPSLPLTPGTTVFFSVGNINTNQIVNFDMQTLLVTTNDNGDYLNVISNLNNGLAPWYRYESGSSMAAAGVSGMLACMEEFFQTRLLLTNSPALMKALLINGARKVSSQYDFQVANGINYQGWGLPSLPNSIPGVLTNQGNNLPVQYFDQSPTNVLATGQSQTRLVALSSAASAQGLQITLVWTDPPGNPSAGVKLVNDLDLIVTNRDTGDVFYGNDIPAGSIYNETSPTNAPPNDDVVNNVENVYLPGNVGTNFSVTVYGRRVNVNAVTANTNDIVQDYALVISSGDGGQAANTFTITDQALVSSNNVSGLQTINDGIPVLGQRVGANSQFSGSTNGTTNQWNFYVFTNTASLTNANFTNVAFITFAPPNLGLPRMGALDEVAPPDTNATRFEGGDLDLYVSGDPTLTNLNPVAINNAVLNGTVSLGRTGTESVLLGNSAAGQVYYIGVKSEDQEGAEYGFAAFATDKPFNQTDGNGNVILTVLSPLPAPIPGGTPAKPGSVLLFGVTTLPVQVRNTVVMDTITHQEFGDLIGTLSHGLNYAVLNNHSFFVNPADLTESFIYDDSGEGQFPGSRHTDGPGSLRNFIGDHAASGVWLLSMVNDSSLVDTGQVDSVKILLQPQTASNTVTVAIAPQTWFYDFVDVPPGATNLTVNLSFTNVPTMDLYVKRGALPTQQSYDAFAVLTTPGGSLTLATDTSPPLNPGRYFIGVFNPNAISANVTLSWTVGLSVAGVQPLNFPSVGNEPIADDAVTDSTIYVGVKSLVDTVEVGVRIDHPRESDLVLTLIDPAGKRVLLAENRGGLDTNGYGSGIDITNVLPETSSGTEAGQTNFIVGPTNSGTLIINYQFYSVPDDMRIYYDGTRIFDSGLVSGGGTFSVDYGPGASTVVYIVMNEAGTNPSTNSDLWTYTVTEVTRETTYATFTEDTNKTTTPIKFAVPPFGGSAGFTPPVTNMTSSFEGVTVTNYVAPTNVDGWTVTSNAVLVVTVPLLADTGTNVLALHHGAVSRVLPTVAGRSYTLQFVNHGRPATGPVSWWKGEGNANDSSDGNTGTLQNGTTFAAGEVGQAFNFDGTNQYVRIPENSNLNPTGSLSIEAWIYQKPTITDNTILGKWGDSGDYNNQRSYHFRVVGGNAIDFAISDLANQGNTAFQRFLSPPNSVPPNTWIHVAGIYDQSTGTRRIYINGANVSTTNNPPITIWNGIADVAIGAYLSSSTLPVNFFGGDIDELSYYTIALSALQVQDVYAAGSAGKCPGGCPVRSSVLIQGITNATIHGFDYWTTNFYTFTAPSNGTSLQIQSIEDGMLFDSFVLVQNPMPNPANYYLPEESLDKLVGDPSQGNWTLEVLDNRVGATNPQPMLVSWQLSLLLDSLVPTAIPLTHAIPNTNSVPPGFITYYSVDVPVWAQFATNILVNASGPLNLLFNQSILPTGTNAGDFFLMTAAPPGSNSVTLSTIGTPPLLPGQRYYLGVQNNNAISVPFTIEVDFDITTLSNAVPLTNTLAATTVPRYYQYDVSTNAVAVSYQLLNPSGNVDLFARKGPPLPDQLNFTYDSVNPGTNNELIVVTTNSRPVPLTAGRWYLGVFNSDSNAVTYTIVATEYGPPLIIVLTNGVPFTTNFPPGPSLGTFFELNITNTNSAALFELYDLSGNVDLNVQSNALPYVGPFTASSANPGTNIEQIVVRTNLLGTGLNGSWFMGVPNNDSSNVTFTVYGVVATNGILLSPLPIGGTLKFPGPALTWNSIVGELYEVQGSTNLMCAPCWTNIATITGSGTATTFTFPTPPTGPMEFYRIVQIPVP